MLIKKKKFFKIPLVTSVMLKTTCWFFIIFYSILFVCPFSFPFGNTEPQLKIYYTSSLNGNLDGCDCRNNPKSGLVKRAYFLRNLAGRDQILLVDTGDILDASPDPLLAEEILSVYKELSYDVVVVGDQEFSNGVKDLLQYRERFPFLAAHNLNICPDETRCILFSPGPLVLEMGGYRVGVLCLIDPAVFRLADEEVKEKIKITKPEDTAANFISYFDEEGVDVVVVLFHGYLEQAKLLAQNVEGIDVLIVGHEQLLLEPERIGETILVSPGEEGNRTGILSLWLSGGKIVSFKNEFILFDYNTDPDDLSVRQRIDIYKEKLKSMFKNFR